MRFIYNPDQKHISLPGVLYALGDPVRLEIVRLLAIKGEQCCADFDFAIAKSTMSHHFKILRESGVVWTYKEGTQRINCLRRQDLDELFPGLLDSILRSAQPLQRQGEQGEEVVSNSKSINIVKYRQR